MSQDVVVITHCRDAISLPTNLLTIQTVHVGYPNATVAVVDNGSEPEFAREIQEHAQDNDLPVLQTGHASHALAIRQVLKAYQNSRRPLVILDPDVLFWDRCDTHSGAMLTGRLIPAFHDTYSQTLTHPRLHTSHLVISDPARLWAYTTALEARPNVDVISPVTVLRDGQWERFDTTALLFAALGHEAQAFTEEQLDTFDHVFCGSSLEVVAPTLPADAEATLRRSHRLAKTDPWRLKGIWRAQESFFRGSP